MRRIAWIAALIVSCSGYAVAARAGASSTTLSPEDVRWLSRVTYGVNTAIVERYRQLGRARFLDEQLHPPDDDSPDVASEIAAMPISREKIEEVIRSLRAEQQRIRGLPADEQQRARMALNESARDTMYLASKRHLMRAVYSAAQLREQMTWFWLNHFNVFAGKAQVRWLIADYDNRTIRPRALGRFRDLVLATVKSPAMLEYLDNAQSAVGRINENYARELMELHTLGVSGGPSGSHYSQQDVQELARVLTGVTVNPMGEERRVRPAIRAAYESSGGFEFNPNRHDPGTKTVLGHRIEGGGMSEVEHAVDLLCREPATARFISTKIATYFVSDDPPTRLVDAMTTTFEKSDGDIAAVLRTLFLSPDFAAVVKRPVVSGGKLKDPMQFVVSSLRLAYDGKMISNYRPVVNWLNQLGEPLYGHVTPDGYPLTEAAWASSGQMVKRFEIARAIGSGNAGLFNTDDGKAGPRAGFPMLTNRLFYDLIDPMLKPSTRAALDQSRAQQEWNTILLASPEWMER